MHKEPDKQAFVRLMEEHKRIIFKVCNSYCRNSSDREDLAQEIIYQLYKSFSSFNDSVKFSTWMYRVALNVAISHYRKESVKQSTVPLAASAEEIREDLSDGNNTEHNGQLLQQFINDMKELDRALMLLYLEERSYREIADILGITETNVATKINRLKEKLKQRFNTEN